MQYADTWPTTITHPELIRELARHGWTVDDWAEDNPIAGEYDSADVLAWLGY